MKSIATPGNTSQNGATPKVPGDGTSEGLIELTENGAKLIYALPGGEPPHSFTSAARQQLFILERLKEPVANPTDKPTDKQDDKGADKPKEKPSEKPAETKSSGE
jgi:hypothetical protein